MEMQDFLTFAANAKVNLAKVDWASLEHALGGLAENALEPVLDGEAGDLKAFGQEIAKDMLAAIMRGDVPWQTRLKGQLKVLAERARVRANKADWSFGEQALGLIFHAALIGLGASVPKP